MEKKTVLVVDDVRTERRILEHMLSEEYNVILADNGEEALETLNEKKEQISLVLLDLVMPRKDGHQVLIEMSKDKVLASIPVIALTAEASTENATLELGAVDFIAKPYESPELILGRIRKTIELYGDKKEK